MRPMQAELDLLIRAALLANLPRSGSVWPKEERKVAAVCEMLFKLVYGTMTAPRTILAQRGTKSDRQPTREF